MVNIVSDIVMNKCVSTIPDECKGVECEIGTHSKRKAMLNKHRRYSQYQQ